MISSMTRDYVICMHLSYVLSNIRMTCIMLYIFHVNFLVLYFVMHYFLCATYVRYVYVSMLYFALVCLHLCLCSCYVMPMGVCSVAYVCVSRPMFCMYHS